MHERHGAGVHRQPLIVFLLATFNYTANAATASVGWEPAYPSEQYHQLPAEHLWHRHWHWHLPPAGHSPHTMLLLAGSSTDAAAEALPHGSLSWRSTPAARTGYFLLMLFAAVTVLYAGIRSYFKNSGNLRYQFCSQNLDVAISFIGLVTSCIWYGVVQEAIMTTSYAGGMFPSVAFLTCSNQLSMVIFSCLSLACSTRQFKREGSLRVAVPAFSGCISSWAQDSALLYITFPVQAVFKSSRICPQMIVSTLLNGENHGWRDYAVALAVSACVGAFTLTMHGDTSAPDSDFWWCGLLLMVCFLIFDSLTGSSQKKIYNSYPTFSPLDMMLASGVYQSVYIGIVIVCSHGFGPIFTFLRANPVAIRDLMESGISASFSQYLAYYIIKSRGPVALAIMLAVRQVLSILISSILYGHPITPVSWLFAVGALLLSCLKAVLGQALPKTATKGALAAFQAKAESDTSYGATKSSHV